MNPFVDQDPTGPPLTVLHSLRLRLAEAAQDRFALLPTWTIPGTTSSITTQAVTKNIVPAIISSLLDAFKFSKTVVLHSQN